MPKGKKMCSVFIINLLFTAIQETTLLDRRAGDCLPPPNDLHFLFIGKR